MRHLGSSLMLLSVAALLSGCGGLSLGGGGDDGDDPSGFDALEAEADGLLDEVQDLSYTDPARLPTSGAATYEGVVGLDLASIPNGTLQGQDIAGELALTVNFAAAGDPVTGTAGGFVGVDGDEWDGTLIIDDGVIDRGADPAADPTFTADMAGVLTAGDGTAWTVDAGLAGDFAGDGHSHAFGDAAGTACAGGTCTGLDGGFVAER